MSAKAAVSHFPVVILVAEDDANDVLLLRRAFAKARLAVSILFLSNGLEVIRYLRGDPPFDDRVAHPLPQLLLLDLKMPGAGGLDVLSWLAVMPGRDSMSVVIFSSCIAPEDCRKAKRLGAHSCMTKPLNPLDLLPILRGLPEFQGLEKICQEN